MYDGETQVYEEPAQEELFELRNGSAMADPRQSAILFGLKEKMPERLYADDAIYLWDEIGAADLFAEFYIGTNRYCPETKCWVAYQDGRWIFDKDHLIANADLKEFVRLMWVYAGEITDETVREKYVKYINRMSGGKFRRQVLEDAKDLMVIHAQEFDADPYLINCRNGVYDLRTMRFREHRAEDFLTMRAGLSYVARTDGADRCERWERFIEEVTQSRVKARYLQKALGYSLLGKPDEDCMFILHGQTTRNGKSTMLDTINHILGDYATAAPVELICKKGELGKNAEAPSSVTAGLKGKRFITMAESSDSGRLDESVLKQFTGGEAITARRLYQEAFTFVPQFTLWLSCNSLPAVKDRSVFASDRLRVIEFNRHFTEEEQDKGLADEFRTEEAKRGIFLWLLEGYRAYRKEGLAMPGELKAVVRKYADDNDIVMQFLREKTERSAEGLVRAKTLYDTYRIWAKGNGYFTVTVRKFNAEVRSHTEFYDKIGATHGAEVYKGMAIRAL